MLFIRLFIFVLYECNHKVNKGKGKKHNHEDRFVNTCDSEGGLNRLERPSEA